MDQVSAYVRARVTQVASGFDYQYFLENRPGAPQALVSFAIEAFSADATPVVQRSPATWESWQRIVGSDFHVWETFQEPRGLAPGASALGFGFKDASLPSITRFLAWGNVQPPTFPEGEAPESCEGSNIIENSFKGKTVGPKPPLKDFVPIEFLNYLISLVHDSRQQGWVREAKETKKLLQDLLKAKRRLEAGDPGKARSALKEFLERVKHEGCRGFHCPKNKALTSEAYALLYFNGKFLQARLPKPPGDRDDDRDDD